MDLPFTTGQFFGVFARYNTSLWPAQVVLAVCGVAAAAGALSGGRRWMRFAIATLSLLWAWMALAYHAGFFANINPAAHVFATFFLIEAGFLAVWFVHCDELRRPSGIEITTALLLIAYALNAYPAIAYGAGQRYPAVPTFGVPCPTTIFTFGVFCLFASSVPAIVLVVPVLWTVVGTYAALRLHVPEDFGLSVAAVVTLTLCVVSRARLHARREAVAWL